MNHCLFNFMASKSGQDYDLQIALTLWRPAEQWPRETRKHSTTHQGAEILLRRSVFDRTAWLCIERRSSKWIKQRVHPFLCHGWHRVAHWEMEDSQLCVYNVVLSVSNIDIDREREVGFKQFLIWYTMTLYPVASYITDNSKESLFSKPPR